MPDVKVANIQDSVYAPLDSQEILKLHAQDVSLEHIHILTSTACYLLVDFL